MEGSDHTEGALRADRGEPPRRADEEICALEQWAWVKFNHQFGVHPSFPRALSRLAPEAGGWGFESWRTQVAKARARLADDLINHSAPEIRRLWASGRWTSLMRRPHGGGAQRLLGMAGRDAHDDNPKAQTWLDRTASLWGGCSMDRQASLAICSLPPV